MFTKTAPKSNDTNETKYFKAEWRVQQSLGMTKKRLHQRETNTTVENISLGLAHAPLQVVYDFSPYGDTKLFWASLI